MTALFGSIEGIAGTGYGWRARQSYFVLHSFFLMSALPFVPFSLAAKLGSSVGMGPSTAFNRHGLCVPLNYGLARTTQTRARTRMCTRAVCHMSARCMSQGATRSPSMYRHPTDRLRLLEWPTWRQAACRHTASGYVG